MFNINDHRLPPVAVQLLTAAVRTGDSERAHEAAKSIRAILEGVGESHNEDEILEAGRVAVAAHQEADRVIAHQRCGYTFAEACAAKLSSRYYLKGMVEPGAASLIFGDSGTLKSFLASDLAAHVAIGRDWHGRRVNQVGVLVILGEGQGGYRKRLRAWAVAHGIDPATVPLFVMPKPADLGSGSAELTDAIAEAEAALGCTVGVVLIDTLSTNLGNADEQSNTDLSRMFSNARLAAGEGRALLFVHHVGHGDKGRERGAYQIRATADFRFLVERNGDLMTITNPKAKEDRELSAMTFTYREIELGADDDGDKITSLVIASTNAQPPAKKAAKLPKGSELAMDALRDLAASSTRTSTDTSVMPGGKSLVSVEAWRDHYYQRRGSTNDEPAATRRSEWNRAKKGLLDAKAVGVWGDDAWIW